MQQRAAGQSLNLGRLRLDVIMSNLQLPYKWFQLNLLINSVLPCLSLAFSSNFEPYPTPNLKSSFTLLLSLTVAQLC